MISNNSILTNESNSYEISQFYYAPQVTLPPDNSNLHSLYGFISYSDSWDETVFTSNVSQTTVKHNAAIISGNNVLHIPTEPTLNDFYVGQQVVHESLPSGTVVLTVNEENFTLTLSNNAISTAISDFTFKGFIPNDDKLTIFDPSNTLSKEKDYYIDCAAKIDVTNLEGGVTYYRNILSYDPETKTITVDSPFTDYPHISSISTVSLVYDNQHPPRPKDTVKYKKEIFKNMFYLKRITSNNISPVVKKIVWNSGVVYDYYKDDVNIHDKFSDGTPKYNFYVMNQFYQVFKCLWNNNGAESTVEPYFVAGNFDDITNIFYDPDDGYKWKYMYTIPYRDLQQYMDENWIPVPVSQPPNGFFTSEKAGGIEVINVTNGGEGYDPSLGVVTVKIDGDGYGATAFAEIDTTTKVIQNIAVSNTGFNYTTANVTISSTTGNNATAFASVSPVDGNGADIMTELGCDRVMVAFSFSESENNKLPTDMQIRQLGLISNPTANSTYPLLANAETYSISTDAIVSNGFGSFQDGEIIFQAPENANIANATFVSTCVNYEPAPNRLRLINSTGNPVIGSSIYGYSSGTARTLLQIMHPDLIKYSGHIIHIENRQEIQRSSDGFELFRLVIKF